MSKRSAILLIKRDSNESVAAELIEGLSSQELADADHAWQSFLCPILETQSGRTRGHLQEWSEFVSVAYMAILRLTGSLRGLPEHPHWEWCHKQAESNSIGSGVEC